jgi:hypothetical protein
VPTECKEYFLLHLPPGICVLPTKCTVNTDVGVPGYTASTGFNSNPRFQLFGFNEEKQMVLDTTNPEEHEKHIVLDTTNTEHEKHIVLDTTNTEQHCNG